MTASKSDNDLRVLITVDGKDTPYLMSRTAAALAISQLAEALCQE